MINLKNYDTVASRADGSANREAAPDLRKLNEM
jgi:hypothetical protein